MSHPEAAAPPGLRPGPAALDPAAPGLAEPGLAARLSSLLGAAPQGTAVVVAAVRAGERLLLCSGSTDRTGDRPVDAGTRFELGSVSKTYTALLLAEAAARGEVRYDDPIARYLPSGAAPAHRSGAPITLLHLATHTSGLPRLPPGLLASAVPVWSTVPYGRYGEQRLLRSLGGVRVGSRPGGRVHYSNLGVGLLGLLLARAAGTDYSALLDERLCRPLGLARTGCGPEPEQATGYWHGRPRPPWRIPALPGAGALRSSAGDLLRYLEALLHPDRAAGLRRALAEVRRPLLVLPRTGDGLGLVWNHRPRPGGHTLLFHAGGTRGFSSFVGYCPDTGAGLAVLANTTPGSGSSFVQAAYSRFRALAEPG